MQNVSCLQLALDNALAPYFEKNFGFGITKAANLAAIFGMLNFFARPLGGYFSDLCGRRWGMRGRIALLFTVVAGGGESPLANPHMTDADSPLPASVCRCARVHGCCACARLSMRWAVLCRRLHCSAWLHVHEPCWHFGLHDHRWLLP